MPLEIKKVSTTAEREEFITFPWKHYEDDLNWIAPLLKDERKLLTPGKHPFFDHSKVEFFLAHRNGKTVGRIAGIVNYPHNDHWKDKTGFFGFFESENNPETSAVLLDAAANFLIENDRDVMRGPTNYSTNETCGLLVKGNHRPPVLLMTYNPPWYEKLLTDWGLEKSMDLLAWHLNIETYNPKVFRIADRALKRSNFTLRDLDMKNFDREIEIVRDIYHSAWVDNWGFVPMTDDEIDFMAAEFKPVIDPRIVHFVEHEGKAVGFSLALPDYNELLGPLKGRLLPFGWLRMIGARNKILKYRIITMGIRSDYRNKGIDTILYARAIHDAYDYNYPMGELSWILEENFKMNKSLETMGSINNKVYRLFDKKL